MEVVCFMKEAMGRQEMETGGGEREDKFPGN